jgi:hypothetical protein
MSDTVKRFPYTPHGISDTPLPREIMFELHLRAYINDKIKRMTWRLHDAGFTDEQIKKIEQIAWNEFHRN